MPAGRLTRVPRPVTLTLRPHRIRIVVPAVALAALTALGACSTQSPTQTTVPYIQADGVPANLGAVEARDLLVLSQSKGAMGVLSGSVINTGTETVTVTFLTRADSEAGSASGASIELGPRQQERIDGVQFAAIADPPGAMTDLVMKTGAGQKYVSVPVLLPDGYYSTMTGTPMPTTATGTSVPTVTLPVETTGTAATEQPSTTATGG